VDSPQWLSFLAGTIDWPLRGIHIANKGRTPEGDAMSIDAKTVADYFFAAHDNASDQEAAQYVCSQFPNSTIAVAQFLEEWRRIREPMQSEKELARWGR
jgi:hypothetical protein